MPTVEELQQQVQQLMDVVKQLQIQKSDPAVSAMQDEIAALKKRVADNEAETPTLRPDAEQSYVTDRLVNNSFIAEGSNLPPTVGRGGYRVMPPTNFRILRQVEESGQTRLVLGWFEPVEMLRYNPTFEIFADSGTTGGAMATGRSQSFQSTFKARRSPAEIVIPGVSGVKQAVTLRIACVLGNGLRSDVAAFSPSASVICSPL